MAQNNFNIKQKIESIEDSKIIKSMITLFTLLSFILAGITTLKDCGKVSLDKSTAMQLIENYQNTYQDVLVDLVDSGYYQNADEDTKQKIKNESRDKFKKIVSKDVYKDIEEEIFIKNEYKDIEKNIYIFDYIHLIKDDNQLNINIEDDIIQLVDLKIHKYTRGKNNKTNIIKSDSKYVKTITADSRTYTVRKKYFIFGDYILDTYRDI